ncbi:MAG: hypothetical protein R3E95_15920 [Thiolinea sp.]
MADKLIIILHRSYLTDPASLGLPFFQASVAAAMQYETEVVLSGANIDLARPGVAADIRMTPDAGKTLYDYMLDAVEAGACIKVCSAPADLVQDGMIPEIQERVGSTYLISEVMDPDTVTLTY